MLFGMDNQRKILHYIPILTWIASVLLSCQPKVHYLDSEYPDLTPELYAEGTVNLPGRLQQNLTMTSDGKAQYFTVTNSEEWRYQLIIQIRQSSGTPIAIDTPQFVLDFQFKNEWFIGEPMVSPEGDALYFIADYPPNLWRSVRSEPNEWGTPEKLEISTEKNDWYPTFSKSTTLLFTNGQAYQSMPEQGVYRTKKELKLPTAPFDVRDPVLAADESFMIISRQQTMDADQTDLYVLFARDNDGWSQPVALGPAINTDHFEFAPYLSPDGKFLFFSRRDQWVNATYSNIYWVRIEAITSLRE